VGELEPHRAGEVARREEAARPDPRGERLASERVIINAPMSFAGAAQRTWRIGGDSATGASRWALIAFVIVPVVLVWWGAILAWYVTFGLLLVPYRLLRRGARKRKAEALRHREMLGAIQGQQKDR
jgi:hypothetical protein